MYQFDTIIGLNSKNKIEKKQTSTNSLKGETPLDANEARLYQFDRIKSNHFDNMLSLKIYKI